MKVLLNKQFNPDLQNITLIASSVLPETENITFELVDDAPTIEDVEGYSGMYVWNNDTNSLDIEYVKNALSIDEQIQAMQDTIDALSPGGVEQI